MIKILITRFPHYLVNSLFGLLFLIKKYCKSMAIHFSCNIDIARPKFRRFCKFVAVTH